jgi:hypothetical protein
MEQYLNLAVLMSLVFYVVKIDRRLTRIEIILRIKGINCKNKEEI